MPAAIPAILMGALLLAQTYIIPGRPTAAEPAWPPGEVAGLVTGLESDWNLLTDGSGVYEWSDRSSANNDWTQSSDGSKPQVVSDHFGTGRDGVQGDNSNDFLQAASALSIADDYYVFVVLEFPTDATEYLLGGPSNNHYENASTLEWLSARIGESSHRIYTQYPAWVAGDRILIEFYRDSSDELLSRINGTDFSRTSPHTDPDNWQRGVLFRGGTSLYSNVIVGALFIYDNHISNGDRDSVTTYVLDKYTTDSAPP